MAAAAAAAALARLAAAFLLLAAQVRAAPTPLASPATVPRLLTPPWPRAEPRPDRPGASLGDPRPRCRQPVGLGPDRDLAGLSPGRSPFSVWTPFPAVVSLGSART